MNAVAPSWKPEPSLFHFTSGVQYASDRHWAVHDAYARFLFVEASKLRHSEPSERIKLPAARTAVWMHRADAERGWAAKGYPVTWTDEDCDRIAHDIVGMLTRHERVVASVEAISAEVRDELDDVSYTHGNELFVVNKFEVDGISITERPMVTINRWYNYIDDLIKSSDASSYIVLKNNLLLLCRVNFVVLGD
jgi:hypothetical protein